MSRHNASTSRCYAMLLYDDAMLQYATTLRQATQLCYAVLCYAMPQTIGVKINKQGE